MSSCPKCLAIIPDSAFGLYTCENCKSVLNIDFDGNVSISEDAIAVERVSPPTGEDPLPENLEDILYEEISSVSEMDNEPKTKSFDLPNIELGEAEAGPSSVENMPLELAPQPLPRADEPPHQLSEVERKPTTTDFADVVEFGNSERSQAKDGPFLYSVVIAGIDSEDLREVVREALRDARFGWNVDAIMDGLRGGSVKVEDINAVKTSVIVNRLKGYPLELTWVQKGIMDVEA